MKRINSQHTLFVNIILYIWEVWHLSLFTEIVILEGFVWKNKLRLVRIFFDTPTFDRIEKDQAAKFVDILSAIGGTMGLFTGFSIISGVELVFFVFKILFNLFNIKT